MKLANVVCGRRFCSRCKRWRHIVDFGPRKWLDDPHCTVVQQLSTECRNCETVRHRKANGYKKRKSGMSKEESLRRRRELQRKRYKDPEYRAKQNSRQQQWAEKKRRDKGIPPRKREPVKREYIDSAEFLTWTEKVPITRDMYDYEYMSKAIREARKSKKITIATMDRILTSLDRPDLLQVFTQNTTPV